MVDFNKLRAPFPPDRVSWRVGAMNKEKTKGLALCYIDARDVMDRLDDVCGPAGWQCRYPHANGKTVCEIGILVADGTDEYPQLNAQWIWKADGAGDSDIEAEKGALSDAFKRSAVRFGIGRYLYDVESIWVEIDEHKRIKPGEYAKLRALLTKQQSPSGAVKGLDGSPDTGAAPANGNPARQAAAPVASSPPPPPAGNGAKSFAIPTHAGADGNSDWPRWDKTMSASIGRAQDVATLDKLWKDNAMTFSGCPEELAGQLFDQYQARRNSLQRRAA